MVPDLSFDTLMLRLKSREQTPSLWGAPFFAIIPAVQGAGMIGPPHIQRFRRRPIVHT